MKKLLFIFFTAGLIQGFSSCSHKDTPDNALALIPQPQEMKVGTDHFKLTRRAAITLDTSNPQLIGIARYFNNKVAPATGFEIPVEKHGNIEFKLTDNTAFGAEGYRLQVKHGDIIITAHQPAGIFYGIQTLLQMLPPEIKNSQKSIDFRLMILVKIIIVSVGSLCYNTLKSTLCFKSIETLLVSLCQWFML